MTPVVFDEANVVFGPPPGMSESQCASIPACAYEMIGGPLDGCRMVVVAWKPDAKDLEDLNKGSPVFLSVIGGLPPHYLTTSPPPKPESV